MSCGVFFRNIFPRFSKLYLFSIKIDFNLSLKSTSQSHRVGTNIQNVISMLKMHHPKLCGSVSGPAVATAASPLKSSPSKNTHASSCQQYASRSLINNSTTNMSLKRVNPLRSSVGPQVSSLNRKINNNNVLTNSTNLIRSNPNLESLKNISTQTNAAQMANNNNYENIQLNMNTETSCNSSKLNKSVNQSVTLNEAEFNELLRSMQEEYTNLVL
jgi:hypothetical protein